MARTSGSHAELTRPRIRAAALRLFARHGFAAVSMRQIAAEVGVQAGTLYLYTPDKEGLLVDLLHGHMDDLLAAWTDEPKGDDALSALRAFVLFHIRWNLARAEAVFLSYMELRNLSPANFARIEALRRRYEDGLEAILQAGQAQGVFALTDSRLATLAIIAMLTGVTTWYHKDGRLDPAGIAAIYWEMTRKMVAP